MSSGVECTIKGIPVKFPFEPYELQKDYMGKVIECLQFERHGVLESPTGTGKTLSLLCSSLAWLEIKKAQMQAEFQTKGFGQATEENDALLGKLFQTAGRSQIPNRNAFVQFPQIIYSSRTHSQLSQAMNELKRTSYKYMRASVLGSREQMCIHPEIKTLESNALKVQMCGVKVKSRACFYHNRVEREKDNPVFQENSIIDIEDLVKFGDSQKFCPYYMSKELKNSADIIFMPYNYLLDPRLRKALGVELANSVIILDEAHNVEKICEDSASMQIKSTDITLAIDEVTGVMKAISDENNQGAFNDTPPDFSPEELMMLKGMFLSFERALDAIEIRNHEEGSTFDGCYIFQLFESAGITDKNQNIVINLIERICTFMATVTEGPFQRKGHGLQLFEDLLRIAYVSTEGEFKDKLQKCYKVHLQVERDEKKKYAAKSNWLSKATATKSECRVLSYWCFSPGFGMNMLMGKGIKSIILTSGTLAPLNPLITELELNVQVRLENPHIVTGNQVCVKILSKGPDGVLLNSSFKTRNDPAYIRSLGMTICNLTRLIPGGLLIFFPSYPIMKNCQERWQSDGLWANICQYKNIFVEPRDKQSFTECMTGYYETVNNPDSGAIFMGVCRGKVSEGLDFVDANGRAVIITGLPYPPMKDPRVILKKRYLDVCRQQNKEYLTGDEWYGLEATKAVNQAVGRVIRHQKDYGAIILLDSRFNNPRVINQMSLWLRGHVKNVTNYREIVVELRDFFKVAAEQFPLKERKEPKEDLRLDFKKSYFPSTSTRKQNQDGDGGSGDVKIRKRSGDKNESDFKRTKVLMKSNINGASDGCGSSADGQTSEKRETPSTEEIKDYLRMVQRKISANDYSVFMSMVKNYIHAHDIENVLETLQNLFEGRPNLYYLMIGMRNFMKASHMGRFDQFVKRYTL